MFCIDCRNLAKPLAYQCPGLALDPNHRRTNHAYRTRQNDSIEASFSTIDVFGGIRQLESLLVSLRYFELVDFFGKDEHEDFGVTLLVYVCVLSVLGRTKFLLSV